MKIERFAAPLGATVTEFDVRNADEVAYQRLNDALSQHHVLAFPEQTLTPDEQINFARLWGELIPFPYGGLPDHPHLIELKNRGKRKDVNQHWHSDMTYNERPPKLTMLYALEAPGLGGETAFANQQLAYAELSTGLCEVIDQLTAFHSAQGLARLYGQDESAAPRAHHPVVRTHDESAQRALYVCKAFTQSIDGWSEKDSQWLLRLLFERSVRPEYQARHQWRPGDLVMWDNRSVLHYAVHDHGDEPRRIHRCQVEGAKPC
jgi:taurine dioxygenase